MQKKKNQAKGTLEVGEEGAEADARLAASAPKAAGRVSD
jgi:hypothetical protein